MKATSEELAIFVSVVESGSFSRAAEQLGQANSAVSRAVKKLEMKLGGGAVADAILDRIINSSYMIELKGNSLREEYSRLK